MTERFNNFILVGFKLIFVYLYAAAALVREKVNRRELVIAKLKRRVVIAKGMLHFIFVLHKYRLVCEMLFYHKFQLTFRFFIFFTCNFRRQFFLNLLRLCRLYG